LLLMKLPLEQGICSIHLTFAMPTCKVVPQHLTSRWKLLIDHEIVIPPQEVPRSCTFELTRTTIIANNVLLQMTPLQFQILPMQPKCMLNKQSFVIRYIIMHLFQDFKHV
jgi:hypothetical protein